MKSTKIFILIVRFLFALPFLMTAAISIALWEAITGEDFDTDNPTKPPPKG
jgi:hypothetical protein